MDRHAAALVRAASVHRAVGRDDGEDAAVQDVLVLRLVEEALIQMRRLAIPPPRQRPHDLKADLLRLCPKSHLSIVFSCSGKKTDCATRRAVI